MSAATGIDLRRLALLVLLPVCLFLFAWSGGLQAVGKAATLFFKYYTEAELAKLDAADNFDADGNAEYVIGLEPDRLGMQAASFLAAEPVISGYRETDFSNWFVVTMPASAVEQVPRLREVPGVKFMLPNRGTWLCH